MMNGRVSSKLFVLPQTISIKNPDNPQAQADLIATSIVKNFRNLVVNLVVWLSLIARFLAVIFLIAACTKTPTEFIERRTSFRCPMVPRAIVIVLGQLEHAAPGRHVIRHQSILTVTHSGVGTLRRAGSGCLKHPQRAPPATRHMRPASLSKG